MRQTRRLADNANSESIESCVWMSSAARALRSKWCSPNHDVWCRSHGRLDDQPKAWRPLFCACPHRLAWSTFNVHQTAPSTTQFTPRDTHTAIFWPSKHLVILAVHTNKDTMVRRPSFCAVTWPRSPMRLVGRVVPALNGSEQRRPRQQGRQTSALAFTTCATHDTTQDSRPPRLLRHHLRITRSIPRTTK